MWSYSKMRIKRDIFFLLTFLVLLPGCDKVSEREPETPVQFNLYLPIQGKAGMPRRVMGDPGTTEELAFPNYVYLFIVKESDDDYVMWKRMELTLEDENWEHTTYNGLHSERGDNIYKYNIPIKYLLNRETPKGRVYAVCSSIPLTFNQTLSSISTLDELLDLKFNTSSDLVQKNLQNIYSTPYNYTLSDGSTYYCSFDCSSGNSFTVDLLLYHIAAKVDLKWNVEETVRINREDPSMAVRLTSLNVRNLFNGNAYCFRPMENTVTGIPDTGYNITNIVQPTDEGLWWEGRYYFYTIPYTVEGQADYFPLQLTMRTNGSEGTGYRLTIKQPVDITDPFVPWIRGNLLLTQPLANTSETRIAE